MSLDEAVMDLSDVFEFGQDMLRFLGTTACGTYWV